MSATWYRIGGWTTPSYYESLSVTDGTVHMWRCAHVPVAGYFTCPAPGFSADGPFEDLALDPPPDAELEGLAVDDRQATFGPGADLPAPWTRLHEDLLALADAAFAHPAAAIALEVSGTHARLVHRGTDPVTVDLSDLHVTSTVWKGWYESSRSGAGDGPDLTAPAVVAEPGWTYDLPLHYGDPLGPDETLHVAADLHLDIRGNRLSVGLRHSPTPPREPRAGTGAVEPSRHDDAPPQTAARESAPDIVQPERTMPRQTGEIGQGASPTS